MQSSLLCFSFSMIKAIRLAISANNPSIHLSSVHGFLSAAHTFSNQCIKSFQLSNQRPTKHHFKLHTLLSMDSQSLNAIQKLKMSSECTVSSVCILAVKNWLDNYLSSVNASKPQS